MKDERSWFVGCVPVALQRSECGGAQISAREAAGVGARRQPKRGL